MRTLGDTTPGTLCTALQRAGNRNSEATLEECENQGIAFLPWVPISIGSRRVWARP